MSLRFHEIAETDHRVLNPIHVEKLQLLGDICDLGESTRVLDLACGKGEMLTQWAVQHGIRGVGVDISGVFISAAKERAYQMDVGDKLNFIVADASNYPEPHHEFDVVTCIGATWIGGGLSGTLDLMRTALPTKGGLLVVGEVFWLDPPTQAALDALDMDADTFTTLEGTLDRFEAAGVELIEMMLASKEEFDRYEAMQWRAVHNFLKENDDDPDAAALREWIANNRRVYMTYGRRYMGWGIFVLHAPSSSAELPVADSPELFDQPVGVEILRDMMWVRLQDGRVIGNPLSWYPWLEAATRSARDNNELRPGSVYWPELDRTISVETMLSGKR